MIDFRQIKNAPLVDIRRYSPIVDGSANAAMEAALAAGVTQLFLPRDSMWVPAGNAIPGGLLIVGEDWLTSKIWPSDPLTEFLALGSRTVLQNVNLNGSVNPSKSTGAPVGYYANANLTAVPIQNFPCNGIFMDVGETDEPTPPAHPNDTNGVVVIQRGQGGGIYGQYNGGVGASSGSAIHGYQAAADAPMSAALRVTRATNSPGTVLDEELDGGTGTVLQWTSGIRTTGDVFSFYQAISTFNGNLFYANLGDVGGSFIGNFIQFLVAGALKFSVNSAGHILIGGQQLLLTGTGSPEGNAPAPVGSMYLRKDGGTNTTLYVKESGSGNTGWVAK
jgi:hypothetical protein